MASTLSQLRTRVQENITEPISTTGWYTPTSVNNWINAGLEIVFLKVVATNADFFPTKTFTLSFVTDQQEYSLASSNPFEIRRVEVTDRGSPYFLGEINVSQRNLWGSAGEPESYYWYMDYSGIDPVLKVGLGPKPDRSATNNVTGYYIPYPRKLVNDADTSDLPQEAEELAIIWASILGLRADQRSSSDLQNEFNFRLANLLTFAARGRAGGPTYVTYLEDY